MEADGGAVAENVEAANGSRAVRQHGVRKRSAVGSLPLKCTPLHYHKSLPIYLVLLKFGKVFFVMSLISIFLLVLGC
jgi:hypothetical protein